MRKILGLCVVLAVSFAAEAEQMGTLADGGIIEVKTNSYSLKFFPGHVFPIHLKLGDGRLLKSLNFNDSLTTTTAQTGFLHIDRFAEATVITNNADEFIIEITASYCLDEETTMPGLPKAVYRYCCTNGSNDITVEAQFLINDCANPSRLSFLESQPKLDTHLTTPTIRQPVAEKQFKLRSVIHCEWVR